MNFHIVVIGKTKEKYLATGIDDFRARLGRYADVELVVVKDRRRPASMPPATIKEEEGRAILEKAGDSFLVALDAAGRQVSSEELSDLVSRWEEEGRRTVTFVIGGPDGLSPAVLEKADLLLSLSKMTFTHDIARLLLLEQLYRAYSIKAKTGYHK